jgi:hypothetical protein
MDEITVNGTNLFEFNMEELEEIKDTVEKMIDSKYSEETDESEEKMDGELNKKKEIRKELQSILKDYNDKNVIVALENLIKALK